MLVQFFEVGNLAIDVFKSITAGMDGVHLADGASPNPLAELANGAAGMTLVTELGNHFVFVRGSHEGADFVNIVSEWLFTIHMLAAPHGFHRNNRMGEIGRAHV